MAKKATSKSGEGESIQGYFRKIFRENPKLLRTRSNQELLDRWKADHPWEEEVPKAVKNGLSNLKSVLRSKKRGRKKKKAETDVASQTGLAQVAKATPRKLSALEQLEEQIDDCLMAARRVGDPSLEKVVHHLRAARNGVVWQLGQ